MADLIRKHGISGQSFYRWKSGYGDMEVLDAKRLKELEQENSRLKKLLAETELDKAALKEALSKNGKGGGTPTPRRLSAAGVCHQPTARLSSRRNQPQGHLLYLIASPGYSTTGPRDQQVNGGIFLRRHIRPSSILRIVTQIRLQPFLRGAQIPALPARVVLDLLLVDTAEHEVL